MGSVLAVSFGHFVHDTYSSFLAPLLPLVIERLSLSLTLAGSLSACLQLPSLLNPFIGYLEDRIHLRFLLILAPAVTATTMSAMGVISSYAGLVLLLLTTGVSVACFHAPAPAMVARVSGPRVGKGMSFFMAAGELGRTVGPIFAVWAVSRWGLPGIYRLALAGWVASLLLYLRFRTIPGRTGRSFNLSTIFPAARRLFLPLLAVLLARTFLSASLGTFLPTLLNREGSTLLAAGAALSVYEGAGVAGALLSGTLSDHLGRRPVLGAVTLVSPLLLVGVLQSVGTPRLLLLVALGFVSLSAPPVMLSIVQDQLPDHRALANGFYLATSFLLRSLVTVLLGFLGDQVGLRSTFYLSALIVLVSLPAVWRIPAEGGTGRLPHQP